MGTGVCGAAREPSVGWGTSNRNLPIAECIVYKCLVSATPEPCVALVTALGLELQLRERLEQVGSRTIARSCVNSSAVRPGLKRGPLGVRPALQPRCLPRLAA